MGTGFRFQGTSKLDAASTNAAIEAACAVLHEADEIFSLYKPESPLSKLAAGRISVAQCPTVVSEIWDECERYEKLTDGWFKAFTPQHTFDPSGLVKSWAAKRACDLMSESGITNFTLNAGGDIQIAPTTEDDFFWRAAISKPVSIASEESGPLVIVGMKNTGFCGSATSGSVERGSHIWNPKNPDSDPSKEMLQITVFAKDIVEADIWATAAFAEGMNSFRRLDALPNIEAFAVLADGQYAATPGFQALIAK
jgi:thiamine biosynthesis lipoprotein